MTAVGVGGGCASVSLRETLAAARHAGASVIVANGSLTGRTALAPQLYHEMALTSVRALSGPPVTTGWLTSALGPTGPILGADAGALWAPDGGLFAIAWPATTVGTSVGPVLRIAPAVGDEVIFSSAGCWDITDLPSRRFQGHLAEVPASDSYARATPGGFHAVPLATVEQLLHE